MTAASSTSAHGSRRRRAGREPITMLVERRFPLFLSPSIASIRELYNTAKAAHWDPAASIPWRRFDPGRYSEEVRAAARLCWSRRAWIEYGGLPETPALLVRFCLEEQRESDPKMFLAVRGTEVAWHTDCAYRLAELLGGYIDDPNDAAVDELYNQSFHRAAFDGATALDAYVVAHSVILDGIDLELYRESLRHARDPVAIEVLRRFVGDKERHVQFGWMYAEERAAGWDDSVRAQVADEIEAMLGLERRGYHCASLGTDDAAERFVLAAEITRTAGLGALGAREERAAFRRYVDEARTRLARFGVTFETAAPASLPHG